jgi:hypothetical protein
METITRTAEEFCLVLTPSLLAAPRATAAIRERFDVLADEICRELATVVTELIENSVMRRPGKPITVTIALRDDSVRGEVADHGGITAFEIPLDS